MVSWYSGIKVKQLLMKMFWNLIQVVPNIVNVLNATELYTLKWLILCCVNFISIKKVKQLYSAWDEREIFAISFWLLRQRQYLTLQKSAIKKILRWIPGINSVSAKVSQGAVMQCFFPYSIFSTPLKVLSSHH